MSSSVSAAAPNAVAANKVIRHSAFDRAGHWLTAISVLVLLATAFLPILGVEFDWVGIHWITGLVLTTLVLVHVIRVLVFKPLRTMLIGVQDLRDAVAVLRWNFRISADSPPKPGKYSLAQKLIHHAFSVVVLTAITTGCLMLAKVDTPWWERDPYFFSDATWGIIYVLHGLAALLLITMIITHVYFALRPEKLLYMRSMLRGWITRQELEQHHDPDRWSVDQ